MLLSVPCSWQRHVSCSDAGLRRAVQAAAAAAATAWLLPRRTAAAPRSVSAPQPWRPTPTGRAVLCPSHPPTPHPTPHPCRRPFKPINTSLYLCDNKFHTEALNELLEADNKWGRAAAWAAGPGWRCRCCLLLAASMAAVWAHGRSPPDRAPAPCAAHGALAGQQLSAVMYAHPLPYGASS